jgi:hypothetical protein
MADGRGFPHRKEDFDNDDRISFYDEDGKYILEDEEGTEWEWVEETRRWIPAVSVLILWPALRLTHLVAQRGRRCAAAASICYGRRRRE